MCLAIVKKPGASVPVEVLEDGFRSNPDGAGIAFARHGRLTIIKGLFDFDVFLGVLNREVAIDDAALIHFRLATSGKLNKKNCHPFMVGRDMAMIHNGVLPWRSTKRMSDTACFVKDVLDHRAKFVPHPEFRAVVEKGIGPDNKLAFLKASGETTIYNESSGEWLNGVWYSKKWVAWSIEDQSPKREWWEDDDFDRLTQDDPWSSHEYDPWPAF